MFLKHTLEVFFALVSITLLNKSNQEVLLKKRQKQNFTELARQIRSQIVNMLIHYSKPGYKN